MALISVEDAKAALGIEDADTSQDAALTRQIDAISQAINNWCDRVFVVQTYRDQVRNACGYFGEPLVVRQYPIVVDEAGVPLVAISEDGAALDAAYLEVYPETGAVYRLDAAMAPSAWAVALAVVDYTAGYDPIPADVQGACLEWLTLRWHAVGRDPALRSETIPDLITQVYAGDAGAGTSGGAMPAGARDMLAPYKIWTV
jgi:hypothetical protein